MRQNLQLCFADDSRVVRRMVREALERDPEIGRCETVEDGSQLLKLCETESFDVILLDVEMPGYDGLQTLQALRDRKIDTPVIMFSTLTERGAKATLDALLLGAADYVTKPNVDNANVARDEIAQALLPRVKALSEKRRVHSPQRKHHRLSPVSGPVLAGVEMIAVAASTGGPQALAEFLGVFKEAPAAPILVVQHLPHLFSSGLATNLSRLTGLDVREARSGELCRPGTVWLAPGERHLSLRESDGGLRLHLDKGPRINGCRPSADILFRSVAQLLGDRSVAIVLTGMGRDGCDGAVEIAKAGGWVLAQDVASSVVWGMPRAVVEAGIAHHTATPTELAAFLNDWAVVRPTARQL